MGKPVFRAENSLTYMEFHAIVLGGVVGVLTGYAHTIGRTIVAMAFSSLFVAMALGILYNGEVPAAQRTIRREPWYALAAMLVGGIVGVAVM